LWIRNISVDDKECKWIYERSDIWSAGKIHMYEDMTDHCSFTQLKKLWKPGKHIQPWTGFKPITSDMQCSALEHPVQAWIIFLALISQLLKLCLTGMINHVLICFSAVQISGL